MTIGETGRLRIFLVALVSTTVGLGLVLFRSDVAWYQVVGLCAGVIAVGMAVARPYVYKDR